jgi:hypothetical protein
MYKHTLGKCKDGPVLKHPAIILGGVWGYKYYMHYIDSVV